MPNKPSKHRSANASKLDSYPLYSRPHRLAIPTILGFLILYGLALIATGIVLIVATDLAYQGDLKAFISFLKWLIIPLICTVTSIIQTVQRRRRTLRTSHILAAGSAAFVAWTGYGFLGFVSANAWDEEFDPLMFFLAIGGLVLNMLYVGVGAAALRAERRPKRRKVELGKMEGRESYGGESAGFDRKEAV